MKLLFEFVFGKKIFQFFFEKMFVFSVRGMNYGGTASFTDSGEAWLVKEIPKWIRNKKNITTIFDIGANKGEFTDLVLKEFKGDLIIYQFEPTPSLFIDLESKYVENPHVECIQKAIGASDKSLSFFVNPNANSLNSLINRDLGCDISRMQKEIKVDCTTLDNFIIQNKIRKIDFLKIDVEGGEFDVFLGAKKSIEEGLFELILFEFGGANIDARIFFKDFYHILSNQYRIYKLLKNGLREIKSYSEKHEIFFYSNFVAINKSGDFTLNT